MARSRKSKPLKSPPKQRPTSARALDAPDDERKERHEYGLPVPKRLREAIAAERENLGKVESLLSCLIDSLQQHDNPFNGSPFFPPAVQLAREVVSRTINGLDPSVLREHLLRKADEVRIAEAK
jgi:hypothetical protein